MGSSSSDSEWEEELEIVASSIVIGESSKRVWVHEINEQREQIGEFHTLYPLLLKDPDRFRMYFRMGKEEFDYLHQLIESDIMKINTQLRRAITTQERLAVCLRFLATGNSFRSLGFSFKMGFSTIRKIVHDVCDAIWRKLASITMPPPTQASWKSSATRFKEMWHFPNCIGAIDAQHVNIQCPINAGTQFYNYKGAHSVVLMALVDADYKFIAIDVGSYGRNSDGGVFSKSEMGQQFQNNTFNVPAPTPLENGQTLLYVVVRDEAFPLKSYLLRPYSRNTLQGNEHNKIFNYRLSRARRVVENAFGILAARWRCFRGAMEIQPQFADNIVLASCCLHNSLIADKTFEREIEQQAPCSDAAFLGMENIQRNCTLEAFGVREKFKDYFNSEYGSVAWQWRIVRRGRIHDN